MPISFGIMASQYTGHIVTSSFESIATVSGSGASSITFSSIPSTYKHLQIRFIGGNTVPDVAYVKFNSDTTSANYATHALTGSGSSATAYGTTNAGGVNIQVSWGVYSNGTIFNAGIIDIIDYASTSKFKTVKAFSGWDTNGSSGQAIELDSGLWRSTSAINSISINVSSNWATGSTFALYGIKG